MYQKGFPLKYLTLTVSMMIVVYLVNYDTLTL